MTKLGKLNQSATQLMISALESALGSSGVKLKQIDGLIAVPSLSEHKFMQAHYLATQVNLLPHTGVICRTLDTGGASPISALLEADRLIRTHGCDLIAICAGDAVSSMDTADFLKQADAGCNDPFNPLPSPVIPSGYNRIAAWQTASSGLTREQLAMVPVLMSQQASKHPHALGYNRPPYKLEDILHAKAIASHTSLLECARRSDGGACVLVCSSRFLRDNGMENRIAPVVIAGGEASGPLYPPEVIDEEMFSCEHATKLAYQSAQLGPGDIDAFYLYGWLFFLRGIAYTILDCFPICFIRAVEAVGLAEKGKGGAWVEARYKESLENGGRTNTKQFPVNTHGGLLSFGAPWEAPALYSVIEAYAQLTGRAGNRQIEDCKRALVYGNGGIFSASAVAILGRGYYD
jgi:acetyl-CoA acetyltransferase